MPNDTQNRVRHYQKKTNTVKKKRRTGLLVGLSLTALLVLIGAAYIGNHIEFTPDGIVFDFKDADEAAIDSITPLPPPVVEEIEADAFSPKAKKQYSIMHNGIPSSKGIPTVNGCFVDLNAYTEAELIGVIANLSAQGITNAVIDLKRLDGTLSFESQSPLASSKKGINAEDKKLEIFVNTCTNNNIKVLGVIHCFADNMIPRSDSSSAVLTDSGALYIDGDYNTWLDPENEAVQQYIYDLALEAESRGIREILLEDFCFPFSGNISSVPMTETDRTALIMGLLSKIRENTTSLRIGTVIYDDVAGEGFSESKGLDLTTVNGLCDHIWMHTANLSEAIKFHGQLANLTAGGGAKLCIVMDGEYLSDEIYIERYKQEAYQKLDISEESEDE